VKETSSRYPMLRNLNTAGGQEKETRKNGKSPEGKGKSQKPGTGYEKRRHWQNLKGVVRNHPREKSKMGTGG